MQSMQIINAYCSHGIHRVGLEGLVLKFEFHVIAPSSHTIGAFKGTIRCQ